MNVVTKILRKQFVVVVAIVSMLGLAVVPNTVAYADTKADICQGVGIADGSTGCAENGGLTVQGAVRTAIRLLSYVAGIASVIMIIIAGVRYITSNGDPSGIKSAKDAIIYAIVGLIVVAISQAIVKFVLNSTTNTNTATSLTIRLS